MSRESLTRVVVLAMVASALAADRAAYGVNPNSLEDAYYRFEEAWVTDVPPVAPAPSNPSPPYTGQGSYPGSFQPAVAGTSVIAFAPGTYEYENNPAYPGDPNPYRVKPGDHQVTIKHTVKDSINENHFTAYNTVTAPVYVDYSPPPTPLKSGEPNTMALEFDGVQDVFTHDRQINNGMVGGMHDPDGPFQPSGPVASTTTAFTLEAAFSVFDTTSTRTIIAKEGLPGRAMSLSEPLASLPTMALKVRGPQFEGDPDEGKLQIELFDKAGNLRSVMTDEAMELGAWYSASVINDGSTLSLYLDRNDGNGYELVGSESVAGALFQGTSANGDWGHPWSIGKGVYGWGPNNTSGIPADFFIGLIDEVRLTNEALDPTDFLFYQEPEEDGDFNDDGYVDGTDFLQWQRGQSTNGLTSGDLQLWKDTFGSSLAAGAPVPEPATLGMTTLAIVGAFFARRRVG